MAKLTSEDIPPTVLRAADMATLLRRPVSNEAINVVRQLSDQTVDYLIETKVRTRRHKADVKVRFDDTLGAFVADLLLASLNTDACGFFFRNISSEGFKTTLAERRHFESIRDAWVEIDLIDVVKGFRGSDDWEGQRYYPDTQSTRWATRFRATPKLLAKLAEQGIDAWSLDQHFRRDLKRSEPIILRAKKRQGDRQGKKIVYERSPRALELEAEVNEINSYLATQSFSFGPAPYLYRVFNNGNRKGFDWDSGGRFFAEGGSYLNWPSDERSLITVDDQPVVEIDISACQLTILHGLMGQVFDKDQDLYQIEGLEREKVKKAVNIIIGMGEIPEDSWDTSRDGRSNRARDKILARYPFLIEIEEHGYNSNRLQAVESSIMAATLLTLKRSYDIPALPVHDCVIVRDTDAEIAESVLRSAFFEKTGVYPKVNRK